MRGFLLQRFLWMQKVVILMKLREVSAENLIRFGKIDDTDEETEVIEAIIEAGRKFVLSQNPVWSLRKPMISLIWRLPC